MRWFVLAALVAATVLAAPAQASKDGIENAKHAGVQIDPAAEELMVRAPAESCFGDPTRSGCPKVKAVEFAGESVADDVAAASARKRPVARAGIDQCGLHVTDQSPYKATGGGVVRLAVNGHDCAMERGRWVSPPLPYTPGMEVTVRFINSTGRNTEVKATLPGPDDLGPVFGPGWTTYAPLS